MQHDPRNFFPIGAVGVGMEQAQVGDQVLFVIAGQNGGGRCFVGDILVKQGLLQGRLSRARFWRPERRLDAAPANRSQMRTTWCITGIPGRPGCCCVSIAPVAA